MARAFLTFPDPDDYVAIIRAYVVNVFGLTVWDQRTADALVGLMASFSAEGLDRYTSNEITLLSNMWEEDRQQLYDIASFTEFIANNLPAGGAIDLSLIEFNLQSILRDTSAIAVSMGGGAPLGIADIAQSIAGQTEAFNFWAFQNLHPHLQIIEALLSDAIPADPNALAREIRALLEVLVTAFLPVLSTISARAGALDPATQQIADNTRSGNTLSGALSMLADLGKSPTATDYTEFLRNSSPDNLGNGLARVGNALKEVLKGNFFNTQERDAFTAIVTEGDFSKARVALVDDVHWLSAQGPLIITDIIKKLFDAIGAVGERLEPALAEIFKPAFDVMLNGIKQSVAAAGEVGPTKGFVTAEAFLSKAAINGMHAHHLAQLFEMIPWSKHFGMNMLPAFMADMAGFGAIASQTWGRAVGEGVGRAAGYEINASMRSRIPDPRMLEQMVFEGQLSEEDQAALLAFQGYNDDYIRRMQVIQYAEPNLRQLSGLAADASMPEAQTEKWLLEIGFSPKDASALMPIIMQQSMKAERSTLQGEVMNNLRSGLLTEADADLYFDTLRLHPAARQMLLTSARLGLRRNSIEDNITTYKAQHAGGLIDDSDLTLGLQAQGITSSRISVEVAAAATRRFAQIAREEEAETKAEIRKQQTLLISALREAFQHGMIDPSQFEQTLIHGGIAPATASATVELEMIKLEGRAMTSRSAAAARAIQAEISIREDTFVELFRKGVINNLQLQQFLLGSGLPTAVVAAIVDRELARARPTPADLLKTPAALKAKELTTLAKSKLQVQFAKAAITADVYLSQLVALGVDIDVARATVALDVARRGAEKQPPTTSTINTAALTELQTQVEDALTKFAEKAQTEAALRTVLEKLGLIEEVLQALIASVIEQEEAATATQAAVS